MSANHSQRRREVGSALRQRGLDSLIVTHPANWFYLTGFTGESGALVVERDRATLVTDGRFTVQAKEEARGIRVVLQKGGLYPALGNGCGSAGCDAPALTLSKCRWGNGMRCGRPRERNAARLKLEASRRPAHAQRRARTGANAKGGRSGGRSLRERARTGAPGRARKRARGGTGVPDAQARGERTVVRDDCGVREALRPPPRAANGKKLRKNELVVLDLGVILGHYCSDMTRTVYLGRAPRRIREWYQAVREAQAAGVAAVEAGITCGEVDSAAREVLKTAGLEEHFVHSTGHGLGLEVHEEPRVARGQQVRLQAGNVITIEPGVYVEGVGGIRIEDDVVVRATGNEVLTRVKRDLIEI